MRLFEKLLKILDILRQNMDSSEPLEPLLTPEKLDLSESEWHLVMRRLGDLGYITGVKDVESLGKLRKVCLVRPEITLSGLEYLEGWENK